VEVVRVQVAQDDQEIIARVAALDIGKAEVVCCVRVPGQGPRARRMQEVRTYTTMTRSLLAMSDWLTGLGVTRVVMEATSDYWKPPFYLLENSFETWLVNAKDVKHLPGRPKPIGWTLFGCVKSPSDRCSARRSCRHRRSGSCGI
jgi:transposase